MISKKEKLRVLWPFLMFLMLGVVAYYFGPYRIKHQKCLRFGTEIVSLSGKVNKKVFHDSGQSAKNGRLLPPFGQFPLEKSDTYWVLHLTSGVCAQDEGDYWSTMEDIKDIQLAFFEDSDNNKYRHLLEKGNVTVKGMLDRNMVGHQYMSVVLHVEEIAATPN
jgi:hypothetical protein